MQCFLHMGWGILDMKTVSGGSTTAELEDLGSSPDVASMPYNLSH